MIDCHLHLQDPRFEPCLPAILTDLRNAGVTRLVVNGTHPGDWDAVAGLAARFPEVAASYGLHPWRVGTEPETWLVELESRLASDDRSGIGEIGLDRFLRGHDLPRQLPVFAAQLDLARRLRRPVTIHCLRAWGHLLDALENAALPQGFLLHSYGGPPEFVDRFVALGAYFSLSGGFFRPGKEAKRAVFDRVPRNRILLESDAPDMAPPAAMVRFRVPGDADGTLNHPANLVAIHQRFAEESGIPAADFASLLESNFRSWWRFPEAAPQAPIALPRASQRSDML